MVDQASSDGWGALNPVTAAFGDPDRQAQAFMLITEVVEAAHNVHACGEGSLFLDEVTCASCKTSQTLAPLHHEPTPAGRYDLYPGFDIGPGKIQTSYAALADALAGHAREHHAGITLDGYGGVVWDTMREQLTKEFVRRALRVAWVNVEAALCPPAEIETLVAPFLGGDDPLLRIPMGGPGGFQPSSCGFLRSDFTG